MELEQEKIILLAENLLGFVTFVQNSYIHNTYMSDKEQLYRLKNLVDEYKLQLLAEELIRINRFSWEKEETEPLVERVNKGVNSINEYIKNNLDGLFIFSARVYTLKSNCEMFSRI